jgi:hypothetical protein
VCGPAPLLGYQPIRVRVESIYCTHSLCNTIVHYSTCCPPPFIVFVGSVAVAAFPAGSTLLRPFRLDPPSLWLYHVFPAGSVAAVAFPAGSAVSPSIMSRARTPWPAQTRGLLSASLAGLLDARTIKEAGRSACWCPFAVSPCRSLTLERRPLPKIRLLLPVSRPRPPRLRLPWHLGAIVFLEHTPVSTPAATFAPSRRCDCGGDFNPSAPTFGLYSSLIVCGAPVAAVGDVRLCVWVCVNRHHCWAAGPLGLGLSLYIVLILYAIQQFTILQKPNTPKALFGYSQYTWIEWDWKKLISLTCLRFKPIQFHSIHMDWELTEQALNGVVHAHRWWGVDCLHSPFLITAQCGWAFLHGLKNTWEFRFGQEGQCLLLPLLGSVPANYSYRVLTLSGRMDIGK